MRSHTLVSPDLFTAGQIGSYHIPRFPGNKKPCMFNHDAGGTGATSVGSGAFPALKQICGAIAKAGFPVANNTQTQMWGNATNLQRIDDARAYMLAQGHIKDRPGPVIGISMGCTSSIRWAWTNPSKVTCLVLMIPAIDIQWFRDTDTGAARAPIDAAWGVVYPAALPANANPAGLSPGVPCRMYYSPTDVSAPPAQALTWAGLNNAETVPIVGGHSNAAISTIDKNDLVNWILAHS